MKNSNVFKVLGLLSVLLGFSLFAQAQAPASTTQSTREKVSATSTTEAASPASGEVVSIPAGEIQGWSHSATEPESEFDARLQSCFKAILANSSYSGVTFNKQTNSFEIRFAGEKISAEAVKADIASRISTVHSNPTTR